MAKGFGNAKPDKQSYTRLIKEILRVVEKSKSNKSSIETAEFLRGEIFSGAEAKKARS